MTTIIQENWTQEQKSLALGALEERKEKARKVKKVNNASLPAGSEMYYYCRICSTLTDVLPEDHVNPPRGYCSDCEKMFEAGFSGRLGKFTEWRTVECANCEGQGNFGRNYTKKLMICRACYGNGTIRVEASGRSE